jgi:hypothetical protein
VNWQSYDPSTAEALSAESPIFFLHCEVSRLIRIVYQAEEVSSRIWRAVSERFLGEPREQMRCSGEDLMEIVRRLRPYATAMGAQAELPLAQAGVRSGHEAAH